MSNEPLISQETQTSAPEKERLFSDEAISNILKLGYLLEEVWKELVAEGVDITHEQKAFLTELHARGKK